MVDRQVALYARVSTEQQARDATIASQLAALREHIAADGRQLEPDTPTSTRATAALACCAPRWSGCAML
jgi:hypothetical protein